MVVLRDSDTQKIVVCNTSTGQFDQLDMPDLLHCHMYCERNGKIVYIGPDNFLYCTGVQQFGKLYEEPIEWFGLIEILTSRSNIDTRVALRYSDRVDLISRRKLTTIHSGASDRVYMDLDLTIKVGDSLYCYDTEFSGQLYVREIPDDAKHIISVYDNQYVYGFDSDFHYVCYIFNKNGDNTKRIMTQVIPIFGYYMTTNGSMFAVNNGSVVKKVVPTDIKVNDLISNGIKPTDIILDGYDNPMVYKDGKLIILNLGLETKLPILGHTKLLTKGAK